MNAFLFRRRTHAQRGFTLLETIVTLVVVSLIVVVLMQALRQALGLRERLLRFERETRMATLQEEWFRDSVSSVIIDLPDAMGAMHGDSRGFSLVSAAPLRGAGPGRVAWSLLGDAAGRQTLSYAGDGGASIPVLRGLAGAAFSYLGEDGRWRPEWKQQEGAPLPRMVRLEAGTGTGRLLWLVPIFVQGSEVRVLRPEETPIGF